MDWLGCIIGVGWFLAAFVLCVDACQPRAAHVMLTLMLGCVFGAWVTA